MAEREICPECGATTLTEPKYVRNATVSLMVEGRCISCGFTVDAQFILDQVRQGLQDLYIRVADSPRERHDKSLQEATLTDYPKYVRGLEKAIEICDLDDNETRTQIHWTLSMVYEQLGWYADNLDDTLQYFKWSIGHPVVDENDEWVDTDEKVSFELASFLHGKSKLDWWEAKLDLLERAYILIKTVSYPLEELDRLSRAHAMGLIALDYGKELGSDPRAKTVLEQAIKHFEVSLNCALQHPYNDQFMDGFHIYFNYYRMSEVYELLEDKETAFAYARLAEKVSEEIPKFGEFISKAVSGDRSRLQDSLSYLPFALAKESLDRINDLFSRYDLGRLMVTKPPTSYELVHAYIARLRGILPRDFYSNLKSQYLAGKKRREEKEDREEDFGGACNYARKILEFYQKDLYHRFFRKPAGSKLGPNWRQALMNKLASQTETGEEIIQRFLYKFASHGLHDQSKIANSTTPPFTVEDLLLVLAGLDRFMGWYQEFARKRDSNFPK